MQRWLLFVSLGLLLIGSRAALAQADPPSEILTLVNQVRASYGLSGLTYNPTLAVAAQGHANWMAATSIYSHTETNGSTPQTRANNAGYIGWASENIVGGTGLTPSGGVAWWQHSPVHLNNMTSSRYVEAGVGYASSGGQNFYVLLLGVPDTGATPRQALPATQPIIVTPIEISPAGPDGSIVHTVQTGQTAWAIAARYAVPLADLLWLNNLRDDALLKPGDRLIIQLGKDQTPPPTPTPPTTHIVKTGQTLWTIAALYQISVEDLVWLNNLSGDSIIHPGDELTVRLLPGQTRPPTPVPTPQVVHLVQEGESLWSIAARYRLSLEDLLAYNNLGGQAIIHPGDALFIAPPVTPTPLPTTAPTASAALLSPNPTPGPPTLTPVQPTGPSAPTATASPTESAIAPSAQTTGSTNLWLWGALGLILLAGGFLLTANRQ